MTIATTNGRTVWAFRYSSEHDSRSHYFSTRMDALKAHYPDIEELAGRSGETRVVVSEPLGDLPGAWNEVGPSEHDEGREPARANAPRSERPSSAPRRDATLRAAL
jgi:glutamine amidotransferase